MPSLNHALLGTSAQRAWDELGRMPVAATLRTPGTGGSGPPPAAPEQIELAWLSATAGPAVIKTERFENSAAVDAVRFPDASQANVIWSTSPKRSGAGALKINIPASAGQGAGNACIPLGVTRGANTVTYYRFAVYTPDAMFRNKPTFSDGSGGWKVLIVSQATNPPLYSIGAFTENEVAVNNRDWRGFPVAYWRGYSQTGAGPGFQNMEQQVSVPGSGVGSGINYVLTPGVDDGTPASPSSPVEYSRRYGVLWQRPTLPGNGNPPQGQDIVVNGYPDPDALQSGVLPWNRDGWTYFMLRIQIGDWDAQNSSMSLFVCHPGGRWVRQNHLENIGFPEDTGGHSGVWPTVFDTARIGSSPGVVDSYIGFAEFVASKEWIDEPQGDFVPPYALPDPGESVAIGTNTAYDITPPGMTTSQWSYALFNNFGGGALVRDYSVAGAWGIIGGGHGVPHQTGAALFDFTDATWKRRAPSDQTSAYGPDDFAEADTTGSPHWYVSGTTVPAPAHGWQTICEMPKWMGGGPKGSLIYVQRTAICNESRYSQYSYRFDLDSGVWSVLSANANTRNEHEGAAILDETRRRWWLLAPNQNAFNDHKYLDADDFQWKTTAAYTGIGAPTGCAEGSLFKYGSLLLRQGQLGGLYAWDIDDGTQNWAQLTVSGTLPSNEHNVFAFFPPHNAFYGINQSGGSLYRLRPPAGATTTAALLAGTWNCDTVTVTPSLPARTSDGGGPVSHYNSLFWVPSLQRLAYVPGGDSLVYVVYPPTP